MSGILDLVTQSLDSNTVQQMSQRLGADPAQTQSAIGAALPLLLSGLAHTSRGEGANALHAAAGEHDGGILDNVMGMLGSNAGGGGMSGLLSQVMGQHQETAQNALAGASGLGGEQARHLLEMLAPLVMGAVGRVTQQKGLDPDGLASLLQGEHQQFAQSVAQSQPGLMGFAAQLLDHNHDGNVMDDLTKGLGGLLGGR